MTVLVAICQNEGRLMESQSQASIETRPACSQKFQCAEDHSPNPSSRCPAICRWACYFSASLPSNDVEALLTRDHRPREVPIHANKRRSSIFNTTSDGHIIITPRVLPHTTQATAMAAGLKTIIALSFVRAAR